jgi:hypothetical protein
MDTDPVRARDMVYAIIEFYNKKVSNTHREKYAEVVNSYQQYLAIKRTEIDSVLHQHHQLRTNYELIDFGAQSQEITRGYLRTIDGNNARNINTEGVERMKKNIEEKGGDFIYYNEMVFHLIQQLATIQKEYEEALYHYNKEFTHANIVSHPIVADKKSYPIRWLILLYTVIAVSFFSVVIIAIIENSRNIQQNFFKANSADR